MEEKQELPDNVIKFTPKREYVWEHNCASNGQKFFLHRDGSVECADCHSFVKSLCWGKTDA